MRTKIENERKMLEHMLLQTFSNPKKFIKYYLDACFEPERVNEIIDVLREKNVLTRQNLDQHFKAYIDPRHFTPYDAYTAIKNKGLQIPIALLQGFLNNDISCYSCLAIQNLIDEDALTQEMLDDVSQASPYKTSEVASSLCVLKARCNDEFFQDMKEEVITSNDPIPKAYELIDHQEQLINRMKK